MLTIREKAIAIIDNDILKRSDAIVLLEGDGYNRYSHAVQLFKEEWAPRIVFSGGITDYSYGSFPFSDVGPRIIENGVPEYALVHENVSLHTRAQAVEIIAMAKREKWNRIILVATYDHQYRAYLTFLKEVKSTLPSLVIFNSPARNLGWYHDDGWGTRFNRLDVEFDRIEKYSAMGHLATFEEVVEYQKWKEQLT